MAPRCRILPGRCSGCNGHSTLGKSAIGEGSRILSGYMYQGIRLYVIAEADRSSTTLLLADEY